MLTCNLPTARILAVEDDPLLASHLQQHLQDSGYGVTLSRDGSEGLRLAVEGDFDLVLMDILLPGISGLQVLQNLREQRGVPVILMSALGGEQDRIAGFSQGCAGWRMSGVNSLHRGWIHSCSLMIPARMCACAGNGLI